MESPGTKRQIKYEKTSCYFCSEWLDSQSFKEHLIHCGQVLEKCPHSCNAYIQRLRMRSHLKDCPKVKKIMTNGYGEDQQYLREHENRMLVLEQDVNALRSVLNEEIKQRLHLITDVGSLRKHNQISDEWTQKVGDVLTTLKKCINEETAARNSEMRKLEENATNLFSQYKLLHDGQSTSLTLLDQLHNKIIVNENVAECLRDDVEQKEAVAAEKLEALGLEIEHLQQQISHETNLLSRCLKDEVLRLENLIEQREEDLMIKLKSLEDAINRISSDLMSKFVSHTELNAKQMTLDYEVKSMKNIVCETEEKCEKLQKKLFEVENVLQKTHQGLVDLEVHLAYQKKFAAIENIRGHLIWKITDYSAKLNAAKQHGTMSQSPLFCNKQYGYTLRMDVHLDGIGTWKGRNIIACLNVVPGDWDTLLEWPCKLQADIILRDQSTNSEDAQDYVKATIVKKKNENYHSNQYIHIPHKIVDSRNFIRHDTIFFEVKVYRNKSGI